MNWQVAAYLYFGENFTLGYRALGTHWPQARLEDGCEDI